MELLKVCTGILFAPEAVAPLMPAGIAAVQLKVTFPVVRVDKFIIEESLPEHSVWFSPENTTLGEGLTVILTSNGVPLQVPDFGVTK